jgi:hypothetical protein
MAGRPSDYTEELAQDICQQLMSGQSLRRICAVEWMPDRATVHRWMNARPDFATKYAHARVIQADALEEDMAEIEDKTLDGDLDPAAARVVLASKQWRAAKLSPKKYGERLTHAGDPDAPLNPRPLAGVSTVELTAALARLGLANAEPG